MFKNNDLCIQIILKYLSQAFPEKINFFELDCDNIEFIIGNSILNSSFEEFKIPVKCNSRVFIGLVNHRSRKKQQNSKSHIPVRILPIFWK